MKTVEFERRLINLLDQYEESNKTAVRCIYVTIEGKLKVWDNGRSKDRCEECGFETNEWGIHLSESGEKINSCPVDAAIGAAESLEIDR